MSPVQDIDELDGEENTLLSKPCIMYTFLQRERTHIHIVDVKSCVCSPVRTILAGVPTSV